jgi:non-specific serine/threonine protein kinase/serine/threonine-protein kinase
MGIDSSEQQRWQRVEALFDELWDQDDSTRDAKLAALDDPALVAQVRALLDATHSSADLFDAAVAPPAKTAAPLMAAGLRIGVWQIVELIGQGGMGQVYRAERADGQFRKPVALKLARSEARLRPEQFDNERQILATLEHPGIARLIDGGIDSDGRAYMVMELVEGVDLLRHCHEHRLDLFARLALFGQVCEVVAYAHLHLVLHRDLKPGNILVTDEGQVKLLDFGIAKLIESHTAPDPQQTLALMTPEYAAPEQLEGRPATTATDVYALGVLLYQLLAGEPPWNLRELPMPAALQRLLNSDPKPLATAAFDNAEAPVPARLLRGDLEAIVGKSLRREPEARYPSASALWADLQRHLEHRPVLARGGARSYRVRRFLRRYRVLVAATAAVFVVLIAGLGSTLWQAHRAEQQRNLFEAENARSKAVVDYLSVLLAAAGKNDSGAPETVRTILERGAKNLDQQFADRPADYARIVEFLGELYASIDDENSAVSLQQTFIDSPAAAATPASAAEIRLLLAQSRLRQGDRAAAATILAPAQTFWAAHPAQYRGKLARSRIVEGQIAKAGGNLSAAIAILRRGRAEIEGAAGAVPEDASNLENSLALALMQTGEYDEADQLIRKVRAFRESEGRISDNLLTAIQNQGAIALARGDAVQAEALLRESIDQRRRSFGPSGAMAAAELSLAKALLRENQPQPALDVLDEARPIAVQFTGPQSPIVLGVDLASAEAQISLGHDALAQARLDVARPLIETKFGTQHPLYASAIILDARLQLHAGHIDVARQRAEQAAAILDKAGVAGRQQQPALQALQAELGKAGT